MFLCFHSSSQVINILQHQITDLRKVLDAKAKQLETVKNTNLNLVSLAEMYSHEGGDKKHC